MSSTIIIFALFFASTTSFAFPCPGCGPIIVRGPVDPCFGPACPPPPPIFVNAPAPCFGPVCPPPPPPIFVNAPPPCFGPACAPFPPPPAPIVISAPANPCIGSLCAPPPPPCFGPRCAPIPPPPAPIVVSAPANPCFGPLCAPPPPAPIFVSRPQQLFGSVACCAPNNFSCCGSIFRSRIFKKRAATAETKPEAEAELKTTTETIETSSA